MSRIFLSYARDDVDTARQLAEGISQAGHDVWWDHNLHGGSRFDTEIDRALKNAEAVVVLWSEASVGSAWVKDEAGEGRDSGRLVPVSIGSAKPPLGFRQFQTIDLGAWDGHGQPQALDELLDGIGRTCGSDARQEKPSASESAKPRITASICVLPFVNMSGEPEQEYFSDGISEDITTDLSKVSALEVVARNTAFSFKGQNPNVQEVAKQLAVSHVLEGSVRKAGGQSGSTPSSSTGSPASTCGQIATTATSPTSSRIQDEISKAIVDALKVKLLPQEKTAIENRGTSSVDAYNLYLMARQQWINGSVGDLRRDKSIIRLCRQATALDPEYAQAWALMALAQVELKFVHGQDEDALAAAERALEIDPALPEAHCIKARYLEEEGKADEAEKQIRTALKLNPKSWEVNREAARMLFRHGHLRKSIPFFEKATSLMDSDWHNPTLLVSIYKSLGDEAQARRAAQTTVDRAQRAIAKNPANGTALASGAVALGVLGENERAREWIDQALLLDPDNLNMLYNVGCTFAARRDTDEAIGTLRPFYERVTSTTWIRHTEADPDLEPIREDLRFKEMLAAAKKRLGMDAGE